MSDTRAELLFRQAATAPAPGQPLSAVDALLTFLLGALSSSDYETAVELLLACVQPGAGA
jgi:hypothetical protein